MKLLRLPQVIECVGLSRSTIYSMMERAAFPRPVKAGERAVAWVSDEIDGWLEQRASERKVA